MTMTLNTAGIAKGWAPEYMPTARIMPNTVRLALQGAVRASLMKVDRFFCPRAWSSSSTALRPVSKVRFPLENCDLVPSLINAHSGYDNVPDAVDESNADHPDFTPILYNPNAAAGARFSQAGMPTSTIARLYHSSAILTPSGSVMLAGSNPHDDVTTGPTHEYPTQYKVEEIQPGYMAASVVRPSIINAPGFRFGWNQTVTVSVHLPKGFKTVQGVSAPVYIRGHLADARTSRSQ